MEANTDFVGCSICGTLNQNGNKYCHNCLSRLDPSGNLSMAEAVSLQASIAKKKRLRRLLKLAFLSIVFSLIVVILARQFVFPYSFAKSASGSFAIATEDDIWPKIYKDIFNSNFVEVDIRPDHKEFYEIYSKGFYEIYRSTEALSAPTFDSDNIYISSKAGYVLALDSQNYEEKWSFDNRGPIDHSPLVANGQAFWGLRDGTVMAVNSETGTKSWVHKSEGYKTYPLSLHAGIIFAASGDEKLYALDSLDGSTIWEYDAGDLIVGSVAVFNDVVVLNTGNGYVNVIDVKSGKRKFFIKVQGLSGSPTIVNNKVVVGDNRGYIYVIDTDNRTYPFERAIRWILLQLWAWGAIGPLDPPKGLDRVSYFEDVNFSSSISSNGYDLFVLSIPLHKCDINSYIVRNNPRTALDKACAFGSLGRLHSIDYEDLDFDWTYKTDRSRSGAYFTQAPIIFSDIALIGDGSGLLHFIDIESGDALMSYDLGAPISQAPVYSSGRIYVVTDAGSLHSMQVVPWVLSQ